MGAIGKYVRHIIAGLVGMVAAWLAEEFKTTIDAEFQAAIVVIVYAILEKFLKRFEHLDPEGAADRIAIKQEARLRGIP